MTPHIGQQFEIRVISSAERLKSRAIIDPLLSATDTIVLAQAAPFGGHRLDMFADFNSNGVYDAPPVDHAWRVSVPDNGVVTFARNSGFTDIIDTLVTPPGDIFRLNLSGFDPHLGQKFEMRVIDPATGRTVGLYRLGALNLPNRSMRLDGIIVNGVDYQIDFYADVNGNNRYDPPPIDNAWRVLATGDASGLTLVFPLDSNYTDIGF